MEQLRSRPGLIGDGQYFLPKGQRVKTPEGSGEVVELIGDKVVIKLDNGSSTTFPADKVEDDSSAG
ncbi:hypothetical protein SAMN05421821_101358 [Mucilaginibacter lappiensis]|uniref:Uncharacterized protein n=1 Tax=Mucilaginibacter lappiensis TaxID=354630 RepID=A0ABR6PD97_9SPHI|nr:hypothetical protein [Mucilaginibacter lappiensis]MBB6107726.1 hypothetical protein [Mucilaginibacter lappiensis]SIP99069.1 hypothetical protein SAMN05421821_101358 [Mucilaginibacter lappiensis]